jgi:hypothetical protein
VTKRLNNIFKEGVWNEDSVCAKFAQAADNEKTYQFTSLLKDIKGE